MRLVGDPRPPLNRNEQPMSKSDLLKLVLAAVLLGVALFWLARFAGKSGAGDNAFFYDLSEKKLFTAPRTSVPPIKGINDAEADAVRAVVISTSGSPSDRASWKVAYLEKYSPELKGQMEKARAEGGSPAMGRSEAVAHRFVKRPGDAEWFPMNSPQAEQIVTEWAVPGPGGVTPVLCTP
jgi:hypothetical protein